MAHTHKSYCQAACALILHLPLYISFLEMIKDKKNSGLFNHMEQNVYKALHDIPTLTELCVLILCSISISVPYMRVVRGPQHDTTNVLNLGLLHDKVKAHCQAIINKILICFLHLMLHMNVGPWMESSGINQRFFMQFINIFLSFPILKMP